MFKIQHSEDYRQLRRREYPSVGDQLDVLVKLTQALKEQGVELPTEVTQWVENCLAVKAKYRKA